METEIASKGTPYHFRRVYSEVAAKRQAHVKAQMPSCINIKSMMYPFLIRAVGVVYENHGLS